MSLRQYKYLAMTAATQAMRNRHPQIRDDPTERRRSILRPFCSGVAHASVSFFLTSISRGIYLEAKTLVSWLLLPTWSHRFCLLHHNHLCSPPTVHPQRGNYDFKWTQWSRNRCATKREASYYPGNVLRNEKQGKRDQRVLSYFKIESVLATGWNQKSCWSFHVPLRVLCAWHVIY